MSYVMVVVGAAADAAESVGMYMALLGYPGYKSSITSHLVMGVRKVLSERNDNSAGV